MTFPSPSQSPNHNALSPALNLSWSLTGVLANNIDTIDQAIDSLQGRGQTGHGDGT